MYVYTINNNNKQVVYSPVYVELSVVGQVIVDDQGYLLDINTTRPHICGDQHTTGGGGGGEEKRREIVGREREREGERERRREGGRERGREGGREEGGRERRREGGRREEGGREG